MRPTILLFDIDGTLISTSGAGRRAMERAFARRYGAREALPFSLGGMTDRAIARDGLRALRPEVAPEDAEIDAFLADYLEILADEAARSSGGFRVHAGIVACLDAAAARPACAVGLGTGNIQPGAKIKLERVGLYQRFAFGGFGSDDIDRARLLAVGAERGAARLGAARAECRVVVIGDTPRDAAAAAAIGAECVAVATSGFALDELRAAGATAAFADLDSPAARAAVLDGAGRG